MKRLVALVKAMGDGQAPADQFDPWRYAAAHLRMIRPDDPPEVARATARAWEAESRLIQSARSAYVGPFMASPDAQADAARACLRMKPEIDAGDGAAVLDAVAQCAAHGLALPPWLAAEFVARHQRAVKGFCRTWCDSDAFGDVYPKGTNAAGVRAVAVFGPWAYEVAQGFIDDDPATAIDRDFYERVGEAIGRGHAQAFALIREHVAQSEGLVPPLRFVKEQRAAGRTLVEAMDRWDKERYEAVFGPDVVGEIFGERDPESDAGE
ncbi:MAG: hypothetical protein KF863_11210 [Rubrivivax sp.]|nr:hypothetical protein [Rubrivivax sp.]